MLCLVIALGSDHIVGVGMELSKGSENGPPKIKSVLPAAPAAKAGIQAGWILLSINGTNAASTYGIYSTQFNTTITNCQISNFQYGIYFNGASNGTIENNSLNMTANNQVDPTYSSAIVLYNGASRNRLANNTVSGYGDAILTRHGQPELLGTFGSPT